MNSWRAVVLSVACAGALVTGCGAAAPPAAGPASQAPAGSRSTVPAASAALAKKLGASAAAGAARVVALSLESSDQVPFTGEVVAVTAQASPTTSPVRWLRLGSVTVSFGDGAAVSASQSCTGRHQAPAVNGLAVRHVYRRAGRFTVQVTSARTCVRAGPVSTDAASVSMPVLPSAPPASAAWPRCTRGEVGISADGTGAGLGHVGVLFTLHNISDVRCRLLGYPGLRLAASSGGQLPTTVHDATAGTYLFPPVAPHLVALAPGDYAVFELEYEDNPFGAQASEPYATACPAAGRADVTLPGALAASAVTAAMAPCGGDVWISPVIPGRQWITFP
jgi:hypothetical protein